MTTTSTASCRLSWKHHLRGANTMLLLLLDKIMTLMTIDNNYE